MLGLLRPMGSASAEGLLIGGTRAAVGMEVLAVARESLLLRADQRLQAERVSGAVGRPVAGPVAALASVAGNGRVEADLMKLAEAPVAAPEPPKGTDNRGVDSRWAFQTEETRAGRKLPTVRLDGSTVGSLLRELAEKLDVDWTGFVLGCLKRIRQCWPVAAPAVVDGLVYLHRAHT